MPRGEDKGMLDASPKRAGWVGGRGGGEGPAEIKSGTTLPRTSTLVRCAIGLSRIAGSSVPA